MMRSATAAAVCTGLAVLVIVEAAGAQQNIPSVPRAPSSGTIAPSAPPPPAISTPRNVPPQPATPSQRTLQNTPRDEVSGFPSTTTVDNCSLGVSTVELQALRETILGLLAKSPSKRDEFLKAEADVPAECARQKAVFYMRSLVLARSKG